MFSTRGGGLDVQPDACWCLRLGLRLFHAFFPKESSLAAEEVQDRHPSSRGADPEGRRRSPLRRSFQQKRSIDQALPLKSGRSLVASFSGCCDRLVDRLQPGAFY